MSFDLGVQRLLEYKRLVIDVELTEEGLFLVNEIPEDYVGSFVARIELVYAVLSVDIAGRLRLNTFNPPDVQNKTRDTGLPIRLNNAHLLREGSGTPEIVVDWRENSNLPQALLSKAGIVWPAMERQIGQWKL